jgi:hypothetical protein
MNQPCQLLHACAGGQPIGASTVRERLPANGNGISRQSLTRWPRIPALAKEPLAC